LYRLTEGEGGTPQQESAIPAEGLEKFAKIFSMPGYYSL
jgi:hypothetical protein